MQTVTNSPADAKPAVGSPGTGKPYAPCRDYDPMFKLYGCELGAGHDGPHRDFRGNGWEEHLDPEPGRCDSHAPWGSGYRSQRCVPRVGHAEGHRDGSGNEWDQAGPDDDGQEAHRISEAADLDLVRQALADASAWRAWKAEGTGCGDCDRLDPGRCTVHAADDELAAAYESLLGRLVGEEGP
jgi:hypothetical protein